MLRITTRTAIAFGSILLVATTVSFRVDAQVASAPTPAAAGEVAITEARCTGVR